MKLSLIAGSLLLASHIVLPSSASAFGGEDGGPWHHEDITMRALLGDERALPGRPGVFRGAGFAPEAAASVAWHADEVDQYLFNPSHQTQSNADVNAQLNQLHFDNLADTTQVVDAWQRYWTGTLAGLYWASTRRDVASGQNILGAGIHAVQDFYSHSNWIDDPARRTSVWFDIGSADRMTFRLSTGIYDLATSLLEKAGSGRHAGSTPPRMEHDHITLDTAAVGQGSGIIRGLLGPNGGFPVGTDGGIAAAAACPAVVNKGGSCDLSSANGRYVCTNPGTLPVGCTDGERLFATAKSLAARATTDWVERVGRAMAAMGEPQRLFWETVKTGGTPDPLRQVQFESVLAAPFSFLSVGKYPEYLRVGENDPWYFRVETRTGPGTLDGTNDEMSISIGGSRFVLDRAGFDDFEPGQVVVYFIGPIYVKSPEMVIAISGSDGLNLADIRIFAFNRSRVAPEAGELRLSPDPRGDYDDAVNKTFAVTWDDVRPLFPAGTDLTQHGFGY